jgi:hypothetical protein
MKFFLLFFKGWLVLCFALMFFVAPIYLLSVHPEIPPGARRLGRTFGFGVSGGSTEFGFWYRFASCGVVVLAGIFIVRHWLTGVAARTSEEAVPSRW